jgi:hypothetical protein
MVVIGLIALQPTSQEYYVLLHICLLIQLKIHIIQKSSMEYSRTSIKAAFQRGIKGNNDS